MRTAVLLIGDCDPTLVRSPLSAHAIPFLTPGKKGARDLVGVLKEGILGNWGDVYVSVGHKASNLLISRLVVRISSAILLVSTYKEKCMFQARWM